MNQNYRRKTEKVYVKVTSDFDATGYMQPRQIIWGDGRTYPIEQVRDFRPASTIADLPGDCYTVIIKGQERHLFFENFGAVLCSAFHSDCDPKGTHCCGKQCIRLYKCLFCAAKCLLGTPQTLSLCTVPMQAAHSCGTLFTR